MPRVNVIEQVLALRASHPDTKPIAHDGGPADVHDDQGNEVRPCSPLSSSSSYSKISLYAINYSTILFSVVEAPQNMLSRS